MLASVVSPPTPFEVHEVHLPPFDPGASDRITVVLDSTAFDWHIDAERGYDSRQMGALLGCVLSLGYEALSEDECESEILPNGAIRIYFLPVGA